MGLSANEMRLLFGDKPLLIEASVRDYIKFIEDDSGKLDEALANMAIHIAHLLDRDGGIRAAALSKELREILAKIASRHGDTDTFWEHFAGADMSTPLRNSKRSKQS